MKLGERFPQESQRDHIRRSLIPGRILYLFAQFTTPPKNKYIVLVCIEPEPILFTINSTISRWLKQRPDLRDCQVAIQRKVHTYLEHDSYVDCTDAIRSYTLADIEAELLGNLDNIKDLITDSEREAVVYAVRVCRKIETRTKKWILQALGDEEISSE